MDRLSTASQKPTDNLVEGICPDCGGKGRIAIEWGHGKRKRTKKCMRCRGTGKSSTGYQTK
jgi:DnaJ-class molecular chaperone